MNEEILDFIAELVKNGKGKEACAELLPVVDQWDRASRDIDRDCEGLRQRLGNKGASRFLCDLVQRIRGRGVQRSPPDKMEDEKTCKELEGIIDAYTRLPDSP